MTESKNLSWLRELVSLGESETLEFKLTSGQLERAGESLRGFLNQQGGTVLLGVTESGLIRGQLVSDKTLRDVATLFDRFEPAPPVSISKIALPNSDLAVIALEAHWRQGMGPFTFEGRPFDRVGPTTRRMVQSRYQQLLLDRLAGRYRWESLPADGLDLSMLEESEILRTVRLGLETGRLPEQTSRQTPSEVLSRLNLMIDGQLVQAAIPLFGNFEERELLRSRFPQCLLQMARFRGLDKTEFLDNQQVYGNGFRLLEEAMLFLRRHLPVAGRVQPGLFERIDEPLFPVEALREALVNAICHRDYSDPGGAINIAIFDDRLEIWSRGALPAGLVVSDLKRDHRSHPRNPSLAEVFFRRGLVERWGRGTQRIVELCVDAGHPEPEFLEEGGNVGARFLPSDYLAPHTVRRDLDDSQRAILQILARARDHQLSLGQIEQSLGHSSRRSLQRELLMLRTLGLVESRGHGRGAVYRLLSR